MWSLHNCMFHGYYIFAIPGRRLHSELSFEVMSFLKNWVWFLIELSLQSPWLYIEVKDMGFGIRSIWIRVTAQLPQDRVTLSKLLTPLNLSPVICETGLRTVCLLWRLIKNAHVGLHKAWHEAYHRLRHFKNKVNNNSAVSPTEWDQLEALYIFGHIFPDRKRS